MIIRIWKKVVDDNDVVLVADLWFAANFSKILLKQRRFSAYKTKYFIKPVKFITKCSSGNLCAFCKLQHLPNIFI